MNPLGGGLARSAKAQLRLVTFAGFMSAVFGVSLGGRRGSVGLSGTFALLVSSSAGSSAQNPRARCWSGPPSKAAKLWAGPLKLGVAKESLFPGEKGLAFSVRPDSATKSRRLTCS